MKSVFATRYGGPEVLEIRDTSKPSPKKNEVLVKIHAAVVTATDNTARLGKPFISRLFTGLFKPKYIPGDLLSGIVEAAGSAVKAFKPGDIVFGFTDTTWGTHAEYRCLSEGHLVPKPETISHGEAASICDGGLTALPFLRDNGQIKKGMNILIIGAAGAVGTAAVQVAKHFGSTVTAVCSASNNDLVRELGADRTIDYTAEDYTRQDIQYDIVFDAVGKSRYTACKKILTSTGRYLTTVPTPGILFHMLATKLFSKKRAIMAATGLRKPAVKIRDLAYLKKMIAAGEYRSVVDRTYQLSEIVEAHRYVAAGHKKGNVVLEISKN